MKIISNIKRKLGFGIFATSVLVLMLIGYALFSMFETRDMTRQVKSARDISKHVLLYGLKEYKVQAEVWPYFYNPTEERLAVMRKGIAVANRQVADLSAEIERPGATVYEGGIKDVRAIGESLKKVQTGTGKYFDVVFEFQKLRESGVAQSEINLKYIKVIKAGDECEAVFNSYDLNGNINNFLDKQTRYTGEINDKLLKRQKNVRIVMLILSGAYLVLLFLIALWLESVIREVKKKRKNICAYIKR